MPDAHPRFWSSWSLLLEMGTGQWWQLLVKVPMGISECHLLPCYGCRASCGAWERCPMSWQLQGCQFCPGGPCGHHVTSTGLARLVGLGEVRRSPRRDSGWPEPLLEAKMGKFPNIEVWGKEGALGEGFGGA